MQGFELSRDGLSVALPTTAQRLLTFLAVTARPVNRLYVAGVLWPDASEARANGSLRSALWRLSRRAPGSILTNGPRLGLSPRVEVDLYEVVEGAHRMLHGAVGGGATVSAFDDPLTLAQDLLPDWYDEWLIADRERLRQLQLHALEALSARLRCRAEYGSAVEAAQLAVAAEPMRESARRVLIEAHLAEGNVDQAMREFRHYRDLLERELGVEPTPMLTELLPAVQQPARWHASR